MELAGLSTIYWFFQSYLESHPDTALTQEYLDDLANVVNKHGGLTAENPLGDCSHDDLDEHPHPYLDYQQALAERSFERDPVNDGMICIGEDGTE